MSSLRCRWLALLLLASGGSAGAAPNEASSANQVSFVMQARNGRGVVRCGLFERAGWLKTALKAALAQPLSVKQGNAQAFIATCRFSNVRRGEYAISAFHDEDNNGKLNTNLFGMPVEDYCATRDARGTFGPPSFDDAKFAFSGGSLELKARLR